MKKFSFAIDMVADDLNIEDVITGLQLVRIITPRLCLRSRRQESRSSANKDIRCGEHVLQA